MRTKHTPGPWRIRWKELSNGTQINLPASVYCGNDAYGTGKALFTFPWMTYDKIGWGAAEANARLIAAAPEMLAALKDAALWLAAPESMPGVTRSELYASLAAVIAKAEDT